MISITRTWRLAALAVLTLGAYACSEAATDVIEVTPPETPQLGTTGTPNKQDWKQCENDKDLLSDCAWITGNLTHAHNLYREGDFVPKALRIPQIANEGTFPIVMTYGFLKGGETTHDFLGQWDATMTNANPCTDSSFIMFCNGGLNGTLQNISDTSNPLGPLAIAAATSACSARPQMIIDMNDAVTNAGAPLVIEGINVSDITVDSIRFDGCPVSGDAEAFVYLRITPTAAAVTGGTGALLLFGAHVARTFDWANGGAAGVTGSPYHLGLVSVDGKSAGSMDLQMSADAVIVPGMLIVEKQTIPDGATEVFNFDGPGDFDPMLMDGEADTLSVAPGEYTVTETEPMGWDLTDITCTDPTTNSSGSIVTGVATYNIAEGEIVKCVFTNTGAGSITIVKNAVPDGPTDFSYTGTGPSGFTFLGGFSLDDDADGTLQNDTTFNNLLPGSYSVTEGDPTPGFDLTSLVCSDESDLTGASSTNTTTRTASISLEAGESVTCTFTNTQRGSITIVKNAIPDGPTDFSYTGSGPNSFTFGGGFSLDDDADGTLQNDTTFNNLVPGAYSVTEGNPSPAFTLTNLVCSDESDLTGASTTSTATRTASISLQPGENVTCTYTNTQGGSITIVKNAIPNGPTDFSYTGSGPNSFTFGGGFSLDDDADGTLQNDTTFSNLDPGSYSVTEGDPTPGFDLTSLVCSDESDLTGASSTNTTTRTASIDLQAGESVTCTFTNTQRGSITIVKNTVPDGPTDFSFTGSGPNSFTFGGGFSLDDDADGTLQNDTTFNNLVAGSYSVVEGASTTHNLTNLVCSDESDLTGASTTSTATRTASISLEAGESVTCTFTNSEPALKIAISPLTGTNSIADTHTLTATAMKDPEGDGTFVAVENGVTVTFAFETNTISATFTSGTGSPGAGPVTCATAGGTGQCSVNITSSTAGQVEVSAAISLTIGSVTLNAKTGTGGNNSANATKDFLAGSLIWEKRADSPTGALVGGATFEVCRTRNYDPATLAFTNLMTPVCFSPDILDNDSRDQDADDGQFRLINLILGTYRITEKIPPVGYILDPTVRTVDVTSGTTSANGGVWVNLQTGDVCEDGKPRRLIMLYTGNGTANDNDNQATSEKIIRVDDDLPLELPGLRENPVATIRTYDHRDMVLDTFNGVAIGDLVTFQNNGNKLVPSRAGFRVFLTGANTNDRSAAIEHVQFHSSCSQPLAPGDEFGSFFLLRDEN